MKPSVCGARFHSRENRIQASPRPDPTALRSSTTTTTNRAIAYLCRCRCCFGAGGTAVASLRISVGMMLTIFRTRTKPVRPFFPSSWNWTLPSMSENSVWSRPYLCVGRDIREVPRALVSGRIVRRARTRYSLRPRPRPTRRRSVARRAVGAGGARTIPTLYPGCIRWPLCRTMMDPGFATWPVRGRADPCARSARRGQPERPTVHRRRACTSHRSGGRARVAGRTSEELHAEILRVRCPVVLRRPGSLWVRGGEERGVRARAGASARARPARVRNARAVRRKRPSRRVDRTFFIAIPRRCCWESGLNPGAPPTAAAAAAAAAAPATGCGCARRSRLVESVRAYVMSIAATSTERRRGASERGRGREREGQRK